MIPEAVARFLDTPGRTLLVKGGAGVGKTLMCAQIARAAESAGRPVTWVASRFMDPAEALDLERVVPRGSLRAAHPGPEPDLEPSQPDPHAWASVLRDLAADSDERGGLVVVDSLDGVLAGNQDGMSRLADGLKALATTRGLTVVAVLESADAHPVDHLMDAILHLQQETRQGVRFRTCNVLKMRGTSLDWTSIPFTLAGGTFQSPAPIDLRPPRRPMRPNPRTGPDGWLPTATHAWDLLLDGGLAPGSTHALMDQAPGIGPAAGLLRPLVMNALCSGWRVQLVGAPRPIEQDLGAYVAGTAPEEARRGLHVQAVRGLIGRRGAAEEAVIRLAAAARHRRESPDRPTLSLLGASLCTGPGSGTHWDEWLRETRQRGHVNLLLAGEGAVPECETAWLLETWMGWPVFRGLRPRTPAFFIRSGSPKGFQETLLEPIQ